MKNLICTLVLLLVLSLSCQIQNSEQPEITLLVSENLLNRTIDNGKRHDQDCYGFYHQHFPPALIDSNFFHEDSLELLQRLTGINWRTLPNTGPFINFSNLFKHDTNKVVYLAELMVSETDQEKILAVGSDDGFMLWVNGDSVAGTHKGRQVKPRDDIFAARFRKGKNVLLYKVDQGDGGWALYREVIPARDLENVFIHNIRDIYADLPESSILPDSATVLPFNPDAGNVLDAFHELHLGWKTFDEPQNYLRQIVFPAKKFPGALPLPTDFDGKALFEIKVVNRKSGNLVYREETPVFLGHEADRLARECVLSLTKVNDPVLIARRQAVSELFDLNPESPNPTTYSTRKKALALLDLYRARNGFTISESFYSGQRVWGYRSPRDHTVQPYLVFVPANVAGGAVADQRYPVVFIFKWLISKPEDALFWRADYARSHLWMAKWTSLSTQYQQLIVVPHGRGLQNYLGAATEEIPLILAQMQQIWPIDSTQISIYTISNGAYSAMKLLHSQSLPITNLANCSPALPTDWEEIETMLRQIKTRHPGLNWYIWHGLQDRMVPTAFIHRLINRMQELKINVHYKEDPHASHDAYLHDPEQEFYEKMMQRRKKPEQE